jgi:hypothetical protein
MNYKVAKIAKDTCVDVSVPTGAVGCIESISTRNGVRGATVTMGNPLTYEDSGWYPLDQILLCGLSAKKIVAEYL